MLKKSYNSAVKKGFTLPEIIVAFSVIVMVILASTDLLVSVIRSNNENVNTLVAYGLAEEGLEAMRNIRDSNWLLGADFQGKVGTNCLWKGSCLPQTVDGNIYTYALDFQEVDTQGADVTQAAEISAVSPWDLQEVNLNDTQAAAKTLLYRTADSSSTSSQSGSGDPVWYRPCSSVCDPAWVPSLFSRYIEVQPIGYAGDQSKVKKYRVSSVVIWTEQGRSKEVRLTTELTDWKGGAI